MRHELIKRIWVLPVTVTALVAAHVAGPYRLFPHKPGKIAFALVVLILLAHSAILASIHAALNRRSKNKS